MYMPHGKVFVLYSWDSLFYPVDQPPSKCTKCGWDTMNATGDIDPTTGHRLGDGLWHWSEIHWKTNSALGVADGQFDWWIDGHLYLTNHAANVCGADANCINVGQDHAVMRTNQASPEGGFLNFQYEDWDDIVISTTGPIGPIKQGRIPSALSGSNLAR